MTIRINIPNWNRNEAAAGVRALMRRPGSGPSRDRLRLQIEEHVPGWTAVLTSSGRAALAAAVGTLGLDGRRLAVPGYVCPSVMTGLRAAGAEPIPIDCSRDEVRFDPESLRQAVRGRTVHGIVATNTYGIDQDFEMLRSLQVPIVDDAAYQAGRLSAGDRTPCGTRGAVGVWSVNFKALSGVGGGVLLVRMGGAAAVGAGGAGSERRGGGRFFNYLARSIARDHIPGRLPGGSLTGEDPVRPAWTRLERAPMSELQAAVALAQWRRREELRGLQLTNAGMIADAISECDAFATLDGWLPSQASHVVPVVMRDHSARAASALAARHTFHAHGIQAESAYPVVLGSPELLPNAHALSRRLFLLPCNASLGRRQMARVRAALVAASLKLSSRSST